MELTTTKTTT